MNFGFVFDDKQEDLQQINLAFYKKMMNDKFKLLSDNGMGKKKQGDDSDSDS